VSVQRETIQFKSTMVKRAQAFAFLLLLVVSLVGFALFYIERDPSFAKKHLGAYPELTILSIPFSFLLLFGLYSLSVIIHGLMSFKDISASKAELDREVIELRKELKRRGVKSIDELRKMKK
jgi:TctA family transporter